MEIKILGSFCVNCVKLEKNAQKAVKEIDENIEVSKVTDVEQIVNYNVMTIPALVINDEVVSKGKVLNVKQIKQLIQERL